MNRTHRRTEPINFEIVIPVYNEERALPLLLGRLEEVFSPSRCEAFGIKSVSYLFVDDGSTDLTAAVIEGFIEAGGRARLLRLSRNFGHQNSISAGLKSSRGDLVGIMDADLQDPPEVFWDMIEKWRSGYEVAYGQRIRRKENPLKRMGYWVFYRLLKLMASPLAVPLDSGDFSVISRRVVDEMNQLSESLRFPRGLRSWVGFPQVAVPYDRPARAIGQSKYTFRELYNLATNGITSLSVRPLQLAQSLALIYLFLCFLIFTSFVFMKRSFLGFDSKTTILIIFALFSQSIVMFCLYILGAYVGRGYLETKGRPTYIVRDLIGS